jgi:hypothetical protein
MTVSSADGRIHLTGRCLVDDAEPLLLALQENPEAMVDLTGASRLHLAVVQVLLAASARVIGAPEDSLVRDHLFRGLNSDQARSG